MNSYQQTIIEEETEALVSHALLSHPESKEEAQTSDCFLFLDDPGLASTLKKAPP